ncbi:MAG: helix-turn-helix domain-containing protein [Bacteroidales bacterium]|nr:helix-turn-helix domain-containing protein [Candidatus Physcocola equi]
MNTYISAFQYLGIMVQGGIIFYFLINAIFLFVVLPKLQPQRNEATIAIHKSLGWLLIIYLINYALWIVPELFLPNSGYYQIARVSPGYNTFMEYLDLAVLPLSMVFGSTVLLGRMPKKWIGPSIMLPYILYSINDIYEILPFNLYTFAYITTILGVMAQLGWYGYFIKKFDKKLMENCSNIDRRSTKWVFWTLVPLFILTLLYIPLNMLTDMDELMVLYDFLTILFLTGIVGCTLSHKVDDMTIDLIKEQIEELKPQEDKINPEDTKAEFVAPVAPVETKTPETSETAEKTESAPTAEQTENAEQTKPVEQTEAAANPAKVDKPTDKKTSASAAKFVDFDEIISKLEEEKFYLDTEVNIDWISSKLGTNRHYVSDYLSQVKHVTFYEYVNTLRLIYAEQLLKEGKEKVADIGFISGFNSDHTFRRLFKEKFGCTPLQYQKSA